ncbi:MAG: hypothetical protein IPO58_14510 [Betaproteobacteria bacterium]|nr:hypothetical protein [Betaproteobacteria bacterium]
MPLTVLAPALLSAVVPELSRRNVRLPNLEALLGAGTITAGSASAEQWLGAQLGLEGGAEPPIAALRLASEAEAGTDARGAYWLCADPIATTMGVDSVRIDGAVTDLSLPESAALTAALTAFFAEDGLRFAAAANGRWYARCHTAQRLAATPLWRAIGGSMLPQLPEGPDAPAWRSRLNEAQMLLHAHPVNAARADTGRTPVTSVWWWGGGSWPEFGPAAIDAVRGGPHWVRATCAAAGIDYRPLRAGPAVDLEAGAPRALLILDDEWEQSALTPDALPRWDESCFGPLRAALAAGRLDHAALVFPWGAGTLRVELEPARPSRWRRWFGAGRPLPPSPLAESLQAFFR